MLEVEDFAGVEDIGGIHHAFGHAHQLDFGFADRRAVIYYQTIADVLATGGAT